MSSTIFPRAVQLRFHGTDRGDIDYVDILPKLDLKELNEYYQRGVYPVNYYPDVAINHDYQIQILTNKSISGYLDGVINLNNKITGESTTFNFENVSPDGWLSDDIYVAVVNIAETGLYTLSFRTLQKIDGNISKLESDPFYAKDWSKDKDLVKLTYYDSENRNGGIYFESEESQIWSPCTFYTGYILEDAPTFETEVFVDEPNNSFNLLATPAINVMLMITELHRSYLSNLAYQLACDHLYINEDRYNFTDMSVEETDNKNIVNVTINLSRNDNNNYQQIN